MIAIMSNKTLEINFRLFHLIKAQNYFVKDFTINKPQLIKNFPFFTQMLKKQGKGCNLCARHLYICDLASSAKARRQVSSRGEK